MVCNCASSWASSILCCKYSIDCSAILCLITVVTAFFMSTETHAKRLLTVWKRSVWTTLKRSFTVLANQINVSETFQAFQILTNHISVRKTLSWKPCLVSNILAFAELANQNPADSIYFTSFFPPNFT